MEKIWASEKREESKNGREPTFAKNAKVGHPERQDHLSFSSLPAKAQDHLVPIAS